MPPPTSVARAFGAAARAALPVPPSTTSVPAARALGAAAARAAAASNSVVAVDVEVANWIPRRGPPVATGTPLALSFYAGPSAPAAFVEGAAAVGAALDALRAGGAPLAWHASFTAHVAFPRGVGGAPRGAAEAALAADDTLDMSRFFSVRANRHSLSSLSNQSQSAAPAGVPRPSDLPPKVDFMQGMRASLAAASAAAASAGTPEMIGLAVGGGVGGAGGAAADDAGGAHVGLDVAALASNPETRHGWLESVQRDAEHVWHVHNWLAAKMSARAWLPEHPMYAPLNFQARDAPLTQLDAYRALLRPLRAACVAIEAAGVHIDEAALDAAAARCSAAVYAFTEAEARGAPSDVAVPTGLDTFARDGNMAFFMRRNGSGGAAEPAAAAPGAALYLERVVDALRAGARAGRLHLYTEASPSSTTRSGTVITRQPSSDFHRQTADSRQAAADWDAFFDSGLAAPMRFAINSALSDSIAAPRGAALVDASYALPLDVVVAVSRDSAAAHAVAQDWHAVAALVYGGNARGDAAAAARAQQLARALLVSEYPPAASRDALERAFDAATAGAAAAAPRGELAQSEALVAARLAAAWGCSQREAEAEVDAFFRAAPRTRALQERWLDSAARFSMMHTFAGRPIGAMRLFPMAPGADARAVAWALATRRAVLRHAARACAADVSNAALVALHASAALREAGFKAVYVYRAAAGGGGGGVVLEGPAGGAREAAVAARHALAAPWGVASAADLRRHGRPMRASPLPATGVPGAVRVGVGATIAAARAAAE